MLTVGVIIIRLILLLQEYIHVLSRPMVIAASAKARQTDWTGVYNDNAVGCREIIRLMSFLPGQLIDLIGRIMVYSVLLVCMSDTSNCITDQSLASKCSYINQPIAVRHLQNTAT
jgi:hypothetical protein